MKVLKFFVLSLALVFSFNANASSTTRLTVVDSSDTSWVARGLQDYTIDIAAGWSFDVSNTFGNGISFNIFGPAIPGTDIDNWFLTFAAPFGDQLQPGLYEDFQRWPFQDMDRPGLEFGSTGRLDNMASGDFEILEVTYDSSGSVLSFAADFIHFGEQNLDNFAIVELRYNSAAVVPVPAAAWLLGTALFGLVGLRRKSN